MFLVRYCSLPVAMLVAVSLAAAEEKKAQVSPELKALVHQLDADEFAVRTAASEKLAKLGKDAIPALEEGVHSESREAATRSFELLQHLLEKGDDAAKTAAKASLTKLAQGDGNIAAQAKKLLEPKPVAQDPNEGVIVRGGGIRIIAAPALRIRGGFAPAVPVPAPIPVPAEAIVRDVKSVSVSVANGVKTVEVNDNGKKIKITDDPAKGIEGEITETKDGKETTAKFAAKDADELKTKHPEAHKLYEQYVKGEGGIRIGAGAIESKIFAGAAGGRSKEAFEKHLARIEELIKTAKEKEAGLPEAEREFSAKRIEAYELQRKQIAELLKKLEAIEDKKVEKDEKPAEAK